ncbi:MAG: rRNA maturation RNase YbeY [Dethiobacter sp.]|jgi:probable rRNA maturation factor|nr:rRNA maturation RNase YbeY [Dethiobacter sp.]
MTVILSRQLGHLAPPPDIEDSINLISSLALKDFRLPATAEISLLFCDNDTIQELNKQWRNIDAATDVLSFSMLDDLDFNMQDEELLLGDIIISLERAALQAQEYGHSLRREVLFLFTHGLLHLLGFDHKDESEAEEMRRLEEKLLAQVGSLR